MIDVKFINQLHRETVARWHDEPIDNAYDGVCQLVCEQHSYNFQLWHEEDIARSKDVTDAKIAEVKRAIDGFNQRRNDAIERIDDWVTDELAARQIAASTNATLNTETPGSAIDRLSIMSLRIYHLIEQSERVDATAEHLQKVEQKLLVCREQQEDLSLSLEQLLRDIVAGAKRHKTYRQNKMYNDPTLNPYLYKPQKAA